MTFLLEFATYALVCIVWSRQCVRVTAPNIQDLIEIAQNLLTKNPDSVLLKEVSVIYEGKNQTNHKLTRKISSFLVSLSIHIMILSKRTECVFEKRVCAMQAEFQTCYGYR